MNTIQSEWEDYLQSVYPRGVTPEQKRELERAFYAGAVALMTIEAALGNNSSLSEEGFFSIIEGLETELKDFAEALQRGEK